MQENVKSIRSYENSKEISEIYYLITRNKRQIKEECKPYFVRLGGNLIIRTESFVNVLAKMFPGKLDFDKWKLIVMIGDKNRNASIDVEYFFNQIGNSNRLTVSHPKV